MRLWHGTSPDAAEAIRREGLRLDVERRADPGDFGWASYLTGWQPVARAAGRAVVEVEAELESPLRFDSKAEAYEWLRRETGEELPTVRGDEASRTQAAKELRRAMLERGVDGIVIRDETMDEEGRAVEVVVYRPEEQVAVKHVERRG